MCDERERLLDYLYDESDATERQRVEAHLDECADCRAEIAGLRAVRTDLLAWHVPEHGSVWTPFAPSRILPWHRQVPVWVMAAAAGVMLAMGCAGGFVTHAWFERASPAEAASAARVATPAPASVPLAPSEEAALEARILAAVEAQVAHERASSPSAPATVDAADVARQLKEFRTNDTNQLEILTALNNDFTSAERRTNRQLGVLRQQVAALQSAAASGASSPTGIR